MRRAPLNVDAEARRRAAELRADARLVDEIEELVFEFRVFGHRVVAVDGARQRDLAVEAGLVHRAADADADDRRRAGIHAGVEDDLHDGFLDAFNAISRHEHLDAALVLRTESFRLDRDLELVARNDLRVDDARRVVLRVHAVEQWLADDGFAQIAFRVAFRDAVVHGLLEIAADDVEILADFEEDDRHAGVLAVRAIFCLRDLSILDDLVEHVLAGRRLLRLAAFLQGLVDVFGKIVSRFLAHLGDIFGDCFCVEFSQSNPSHFLKKIHTLVT